MISHPAIDSRVATKLPQTDRIRWNDLDSSQSPTTLQEVPSSIAPVSHSPEER